MKTTAQPLTTASTGSPIKPAPSDAERSPFASLRENAELSRSAFPDATRRENAEELAGVKISGIIGTHTILFGMNIAGINL